MGSGSLTRDQTPALLPWAWRVLATGSPGKSPESFLIALDVCVWISALRNTLGSGREGSSHVLEQPSALNIHPCVPLSLQVFFVIAQAWVPSSGQRTMNRCDVSHVWTKAAWSWGAFFSSLFPTGVTWVKRHQNYKMRGLVWPGWDFVFIEKWVFLLPQHSLALPDWYTCQSLCRSLSGLLSSRAFPMSLPSKQGLERLCGWSELP